MCRCHNLFSEARIFLDGEWALNLTGKKRDVEEKKEKRRGDVI